MTRALDLDSLSHLWPWVSQSRAWCSEMESGLGDVGVGAPPHWGRQRNCELCPTPQAEHRPGAATGLLFISPELRCSLSLIPPLAHGPFHDGWGTRSEQLLLNAARAPVCHQLPRCPRATKVQEASWECITFQRGVTLGRTLEKDKLPTSVFLGFPHSSAGKESTCNAGDLDLILGWEDPLEKGKATHSRFLAGEFMDCLVHVVTKSWT